jgi:hypothetical protein
MAQTDEQRVEAPIRLARYQLQLPFQNKVLQGFSPQYPRKPIRSLNSYSSTLRAKAQ